LAQAYKYRIPGVCFSAEHPMTDSSKGTSFLQAQTPSQKQSFFGRTDWLSFALASIIGLAVYLYTLSPEVTLEWSGIQITGAKYGGSGPPPGSPLWTIYAWLFIQILPISNIAWRVSVSSAIAGALTCGTIALIVSRGGLMVLERIKRFKRLARSEESQVRYVCGVVAGLGFGFNGQFWNLALIARPDALGLLITSIVFCVLLRWSYKPRQIGYLYLAAFLYGLSLTVQISLASLAPALPIVVLLLRPALGRDLLALTALILGLAVVAFKLGCLPGILDAAGQFSSLWPTYRNFAIFYALIAVWMVIESRRLLTHWRAAAIASMLCVSALFLYFYLPFASMTNPPVNWGYPRTVEGFYHMVGRGQFERLTPMSVIVEREQVLEATWHLLGETVRAVSWVYLLACIIPLFLLRRILGRGLRWIVALGASFLLHTILVLIMLNPPPDRGAWSMAILYFLPSYMILTIWAGYGLAFLASVIGRWRPSAPRSP
jgi:hypothetical protein